MPLESTEYKYCIVPFTDITINKLNLHPCTCRVWVNPVYIIPHNIFVPYSTIQAWKSPVLSAFRHALRQRDQSICDKTNCPIKRLYSFDELSSNKPKLPIHIIQGIYDFISYKSESYDEYPTKVHLAYDYSCNLKCITCRTTHIIDKYDDFEIPYRLNVLDFIQHASVLTITDTADPFASLHYSSILNHSIPVSSMFDHVCLMTNGLLLDEPRYTKIVDSHYIQNISVSVDACTKTIYDKIRIGGNWNKLQDNFKFIKHLKSIGKLKHIYVNFVIQRYNLHEALQFTQWAIHNNFDGVNFNMPVYWDTGRNVST